MLQGPLGSAGRSVNVDPGVDPIIVGLTVEAVLQEDVGVGGFLITHPDRAFGFLELGLVVGAHGHIGPAPGPEAATEVVKLTGGNDLLVRGIENIGGYLPGSGEVMNIQLRAGGQAAVTGGRRAILLGEP